MNKKYLARLLGMVIFACLYYLIPSYINFDEYSSLGRLVFFTLTVLCFLGFIEELVDKK